MKSFKQIKQELSIKDPELYQELMTEVQVEINDLKKHWGGKRIGSGRPKKYPDRKSITKQVSNDTISIIKAYAKEKAISENEALEILVNTGFTQLKQA
jgi:hypothetical protein